MSINLWAVLVAGVVNMILGFAWYAGPVFGKKWTHLLGRTLEQQREEMRSRSMAGLFLAQFISALVTSYVLAYFVNVASVETLWQGAMVGLFTGIGFVLAGNLGNYLFENRPLKLYFINSGYMVLSLVLTGAIIAVWR